MPFPPVSWTAPRVVAPAWRSAVHPVCSDTLPQTQSTHKIYIFCLRPGAKLEQCCWRYQTIGSTKPIGRRVGTRRIHLNRIILLLFIYLHITIYNNLNCYNIFIHKICVLFSFRGRIEELFFSRQ